MGVLWVGGPHEGENFESEGHSGRCRCRMYGPSMNESESGWGKEDRSSEAQGKGKTMSSTLVGYVCRWTAGNQKSRY